MNKSKKGKNKYPSSTTVTTELKKVDSVVTENKNLINQSELQKQPNVINSNKIIASLESDGKKAVKEESHIIRTIIIVIYIVIIFLIAFCVFVGVNQARAINTEYEITLKYICIPKNQSKAEYEYCIEQTTDRKIDRFTKLFQDVFPVIISGIVTTLCSLLINYLIQKQKNS